VQLERRRAKIAGMPGSSRLDLAMVVSRHGTEHGKGRANCIECAGERRHTADPTWRHQACEQTKTARRRLSVEYAAVSEGDGLVAPRDDMMGPCRHWQNGEHVVLMHSDCFQAADRCCVTAV